MVVNKVPIAAKKYEQSYYYGSTEMSKARSDIRKAMKKNFTSQELKMNEKKNNTEVSNNENSKVNNSDSQDLQRNIQITNSNDISLEKTNDILKQINEYIDNEKKNLK